MTTTDTEPTRWRKKPVEIDAWRVAELNHAAGHDWHALPEPVRDAYEEGGWVFGALVDEERCISVPTLEGSLLARPDDWIIRGVQGEFYPCKPDIFAATYEPAEPHPVAHVELFTDPTGDHRWRAIARNGEIVATSGEGYRNAAHARAMAERILPGVGVRDEGADRG